MKKKLFTTIASLMVFALALTVAQYTDVEGHGIKGRFHRMTIQLPLVSFLSGNATPMTKASGGSISYPAATDEMVLVPAVIEDTGTDLFPEGRLLKPAVMQVPGIRDFSGATVMRWLKGANSTTASPAHIAFHLPSDFKDQLRFTADAMNLASPVEIDYDVTPFEDGEGAATGKIVNQNPVVILGQAENTPELVQVELMADGTSKGTVRFEAGDWVRLRIWRNNRIVFVTPGHSATDPNFAKRYNAPLDILSIVAHYRPL